eukprot:scaffold14870_cov82-Skeletonema_dohrnii-CCMP3373.AAC.2
MVELRRQHNDSESGLGLADVIISVQFKDKKQASNRFDTEREKDQNNWTGGRLTSQFRRAEEEAQIAKRIAVAARLEAENNATGN